MSDELFNGAAMGEIKKLDLLRVQTLKESFKKPYTGTFLMEGELEQPDWLIEDFLARQNITNLSGPPGGGKTTLALLAAANNISESFLYLKSKEFRTVFIDEENGIFQTKYVFRRIMNGLNLTPEQKKKACENSIFYSMEGFRIDQMWADGLLFLLLRMEREGNRPDVIMIDNVSRIFEGDSNTQEAAKMIHRYLKPIAIRFNCAILLLSHTRKGNPETLSDISGSGDFGAQVTIAYISKKVGVTGNTVNMWFKKVKNNIGIPENSAQSYDVCGTEENVKIVFRGSTKEIMHTISDNIREEIMGFMDFDVEYTWKQIIDAMRDKGFKDGTIRKRIELMVGKDLVKNARTKMYKKVL